MRLRYVITFSKRFKIHGAPRVAPSRLITLSMRNQVRYKRGHPRSAPLHYRKFCRVPADGHGRVVRGGRSIGDDKGLGQLRLKTHLTTSWPSRYSRPPPLPLPPPRASSRASFRAFSRSFCAIHTCPRKVIDRRSPRNSSRVNRDERFRARGIYSARSIIRSLI